MFQKILLFIGVFTLANCHHLFRKPNCCKRMGGYTQLKPLSNHSTKGWVKLEKTGRKEVKVTAKVTGLKPNSQHGFHIHEYGSCEDNGQKAGGHFNPRGHRHGSPSQKEHHLGDLGNLEADASGQAVFEKTIHGKVPCFAGRSFVVHSKPDDFHTQPSGGSGKRISCGVIGIVSGQLN